MKWLIEWRFDQGAGEVPTLLAGGVIDKNSPETGHIKFLAEKSIVKHLTFVALGSCSALQYRFVIFTQRTE